MTTSVSTITHSDAAFRSAIKRVTAACRSLVIALLDDSELSNEHITLLYTSTVNAFHQTIDEFTSLGISETSLCDILSFPDDLRIEIEHIFAQSNNIDGQELTISGEKINFLIRKLIKSLQEKARGHLSLTTAALVADNRSLENPSNLPIVPAPPGGLMDHPERRNSPNISDNEALVQKSSGTSDATLSTMKNTHPIHSNSDAPISRLFLQVGNEIKRVNVVKSTTMDYSTLHDLFSEKFKINPSIDHSNHPKIYIQDKDCSSISYEMEDLSEIYDGCLLRLQDQATSPIDGTITSQSSKTTKTSLFQSKTAEIRREFTQLRGSIRNHIMEMHTTIQSVKQQTKLVHNARNSPGSITNSVHHDTGRMLLEPTKVALHDAIGDVRDRVIDLDDLVESIRRDMLSRGAVPNQGTLDYTSTVIEQIRHDISLARSQVEQNRPAWRTVWENDLKRVLDEQENFENKENSIEESAQRLDALANLTKKLSRVVTLASTNPRAVIPRPRSFDQVLPLQDHGQICDRESVLAELTNVLDIDAMSELSVKRMRALRRTENIKSWERTHRRSELYWELRQFAGLTTEMEDLHLSSLNRPSCKLKSTGGIEALEIKRAARDKQTITAIYAQIKQDRESPSNLAVPQSTM